MAPSGYGKGDATGEAMSRSKSKVVSESGEAWGPASGRPHKARRFFVGRFFGVSNFCRPNFWFVELMSIGEHNRREIAGKSPWTLSHVRIRDVN